jgi:hypothetical protein
MSKRKQERQKRKTGEEIKAMELRNILVHEMKIIWI